MYLVWNVEYSIEDVMCRYRCRHADSVCRDKKSPDSRAHSHSAAPVPIRSSCPHRPGKSMATPRSETHNFRAVGKFRDPPSLELQFIEPGNNTAALKCDIYTLDAINKPYINLSACRFFGAFNP